MTMSSVDVFEDVRSKKHSEEYTILPDAASGNLHSHCRLETLLLFLFL